MFDFKLLADKAWPWEKDIAPDASNDVADVYVESVYTKYLRTNKDTKRVIPSLEKHCVAVIRWKDTKKHEWVIMDDKGVLYSTTNLESLYVHLDIYNMSGRSS
jgi:hypothetical protein